MHVYYALATQHTKVVADNLAKLQQDRAALQSIMLGTLEEVATHGTFESLLDNIKESNEAKATMEKTILKYEFGSSTV